jgi:hypothetical protein
MIAEALESGCKAGLSALSASASLPAASPSSAAGATGICSETETVSNAGISFIFSELFSELNEEKNGKAHTAIIKVMRGFRSVIMCKPIIPYYRQNKNKLNGGSTQAA